MLSPCYFCVFLLFVCFCVMLLRLTCVCLRLDWFHGNGNYIKTAMVLVFTSSSVYFNYSIIFFLLPFSLKTSLISAQRSKFCLWPQIASVNKVFSSLFIQKVVLFPNNSHISPHKWCIFLDSLILLPTSLMFLNKPYFRSLIVFHKKPYILTTSHIFQRSNILKRRKMHRMQKGAMCASFYF